MADTAKLSIIILDYNEEKYIGPCLEAIKNQTVAPDEVIVVDNNSTDNSIEIAKRYPFVKIINESEQGMIPARNTGFNTAHGQLLARIDADTQLPPDWVKAAHTVMDSHADSICAVSGPQYFYIIKNRMIRKMVSDILSEYGYFGITRLMLRHETLFGSNMIITSKAWGKVKEEVCNDGQEVHEDIDLAIHIGTYGTILYDKRLIVGISARPMTEGTRKRIWRLKTWFTTITKHRKLFTQPAVTSVTN